MYSFVLKAHQKIDKVAYRHLELLLHQKPLFSLKELLYFEGPRGPDAARLKKGKGKPPWHFYNPTGSKNDNYIEAVSQNYATLVNKLKDHDHERAAFEAAWLAHALVDGLTPAHHFPYEAELKALRHSEKDTRETVGSHFIVKGDSHRETINRSLLLIGPKGLLTTHTTFEAGAATIILPMTLTNAIPDLGDKERHTDLQSVLDTFRLYASEIQALNMYGRFYKSGWTPWLARDIRRELAPRMVKIVTLALYAAFCEAGLTGHRYESD